MKFSPLLFGCVLKNKMNNLNEIKDKVLRFPNSQVSPSIINLDQIKGLVDSILKCLSENIDGDVVEFGCFVGESSKYLRKSLDEYNSAKHLYVYDSFEGLPPLSDWEQNSGWTPGTLKSTQEQLIGNFTNNNLTPPIIHKDWFKNIPEEKIPESISFAFLDGDFYDSIYDSLSKIYDKVSPGGYILFHDFDRPDLPGVKAAASEFFSERNVEFNYEVLCDQLAIFKKPKSTSISLHDALKKHGSDKIFSQYDQIYSQILEPLKNKSIKFLEIGLGTLDPSIPSTYCGNLSYFPNYKPAGILRAWADFFAKGDIYGIDVAEDCMISGDRITTFLGSSKDLNFCNNNFADESLDVIIDDGLHDFESQVVTLSHFFNKVKKGGFYIIEDITREVNGESLLSFKNHYISSVINKHSYCHFGNLLVVCKNFSKQGLIDLPRMLAHSTTPPESTNIQAPTNKVEDLTIVSGLWDINRVGRDWSRYEEHFDNFLKIPCNLVLWIPKSLESFVWQRRSKENTFVRIYELEDIKNGMFAPFWDKWQSIRTSQKWQNQAGWLPESPQCKNEYYNPIVMSKMFFLHDSKIWNPFDTDYFVWLDAGITQTVHNEYFYNPKILSGIRDAIDPFIFLSYPYEANTEIHGFEFNAINKYAGEKVDYVCRGGLFGGHKDFLTDANGEYYNTLSQTINAGYAGTEESVFSIMSKSNPQNYKRFSLDGNGLIVKFIQALDSGVAKLVDVISNRPKFKPISNDISKVKTNLYFLTFNFPEQLEATIKSLQLHDDFLTHPKEKIIIDNSTNQEARLGNKLIADQYGFTYISMEKNTGICGGRQFAAEHFDSGDSDFYLFFEDDMTISDPEEGICRNGFRKYVPKLYKKIHQIMLKEKFDFLKLSYSEVYMDNNIQVSWYNVPQNYRTKIWPDYDKLPVSGLDPNCPRTDFKNIELLDGLSYISGDIYYANWPHITSREGNKKMFIDTKWAHPYEQTWMSHIFQETKKGNINPAVLLASAVTHDRFKHYKPEERIEG